jgi:NAD(P) transhydrogenase subunit alpha
MKVAVVAEWLEGETRVALVPGQVGTLTVAGCTVLVEPGAGVRAGFTDQEYLSAGAEVTADAVGQADVVLSVQPVALDLVPSLRLGAATLSFLPVAEHPELVAALRQARVNAFAMEQVPRISRAQSMDALTSQSLVAGYRGAVVAVGLLRRFFPLTMTAAGTLPAAEVLVLGAGVAGLQAIATARRLGAVVRGYDVRPSSAEEISSLGAEALVLGLEPLQGVAGYAREMTPERAARQQELLAPYVAAADAVITTAAVPGRPAPVLVTRAMVEAMRPGSVVVDLVAEVGGNVEGVIAGRLVSIGGAQVWGGANVAAQMPGPASELYSRNVVSLLGLMITRRADGIARFVPDFDDEIVRAAVVTRADRA